MQKKDFDAVVGAIKRAKTRTTAAIRELLRDRDTKSEDAALDCKLLTERGRVSALIDEENLCRNRRACKATRY